MPNFTSATLNVSLKTWAGRNLYGGNDKAEHFAIALRELLQNARDAVVARRKLDQEYVGKVKIRLDDAIDGPAALEVIDDGVGMSQRVLTGPLLDFGSSFWKSDLLNDEFPGLRSSNFSSVGRYGIGFYSTFIIYNSVRVASRRWDRELDSVPSINFPRGLTLVPVLSTEAGEAFSGSISTRVTCTLKSINDRPPSERIYKPDAMREFRVSFPDFVSRLTLGLDVLVEVSLNHSNWMQVHEPIEHTIKTDEAKIEWLKKITLSEYWPSVVPSLEEAATRLRPIYVNGAPVGLAALRLEQGDSALSGGLSAVGGFQHGGYGAPTGQQNFYGYVEQLPNSAKREPGKRMAPNSVLGGWIKEQLQLLEGRQMTPAKIVRTNISSLRF